MLRTLSPTIMHRSASTGTEEGDTTSESSNSGATIDQTVEQLGRLGTEQLSQTSRVLHELGGNFGRPQQVPSLTSAAPRLEERPSDRTSDANCDTVKSYGCCNGTVEELSGR